VIKTRPLGSITLRLPELGFGAAPLGNLYQAMTDEQAQAMLELAWNKGFRYFDTAPHYGQGLSERRLGDILRQLQGRRYILSSKAGRLLKPATYARDRHGFCSPMPFDIHYDYSYDGVMRSFEDSLQRLGLARLDILFMHDIGNATHGSRNDELFPIAMSGGYRAMNELREQGLVQAIGLGVNEVDVCEAAMEHGDWDCFLLAGRYTLLEQAALDTFLPKCQQRNCSVVIGGPYNSGILATGTKTGVIPYYNYAPALPPVIHKVKQLEMVCDRYRLPLAAAALQFPLAHPAVASVIPGMASTSQVTQTLSLMNTNIPGDFWRDLRSHGLVHPDAPLPGGL
jgi:D-threo-aldose 1-dehydrogenase